MTYSEAVRLNPDALAHPQVGDHFQEMLTYHLFVVEVTPSMVVYIDGSAPVSFPDGGTLGFASRPDFAKWNWMLIEDRGVDVSGWLDNKKAGG